MLASTADAHTGHKYGGVHSVAVQAYAGTADTAGAASQAVSDGWLSRR